MDEDKILKAFELKIIDLLPSVKEKEYPYNYCEIEKMAQALYDIVSKAESESEDDSREELEENCNSIRCAAEDFKSDIEDILEEYKSNFEGIPFYSDLQNAVWGAEF